MRMSMITIIMSMTMTMFRNEKIGDTQAALQALMEQIPEPGGRALLLQTVIDNIIIIIIMIILFNIKMSLSISSSMIMIIFLKQVALFETLLAKIQTLQKEGKTLEQARIVVMMTMMVMIITIMIHDDNDCDDYGRDGDDALYLSLIFSGARPTDTCT